jgi:hypothetical protein
MPPLAHRHCRVVVHVDEREVTLSMIDSNGTELENDAFALKKAADAIDPRHVCRDVYNLLYQCATDAVHRDEA